MTTKKGTLRATNLAALTLGTLTALVLSFGTANAELVGIDLHARQTTCNYNLVGVGCSYTYCDVHDGEGGCSHYAAMRCGVWVGLADPWCFGDVSLAPGIIQTT